MLIYASKMTPKLIIYNTLQQTIAKFDSPINKVTWHRYQRCQSTLVTRIMVEIQTTKSNA